ncbi:DUF6364 family protein [Rhizobium sullae]|uniref:CopG family transcriptional regulator n=1 Tax=Rhizobium sullae TaxID=50338 RepID=A0A4R3PV31_RHISU|nr:DUF6364 family protein [Rhizobium sullae]TCU11887.1 hypothetical protein EV132_11659 [Rhizobium sullae]
MSGDAYETTLAIDDDVLDAAKAMAEQQDKSLGEIISDLARKSLIQARSPVMRNGVPLIKEDPTGRAIAPEFVNELRDEYT